MAEVTLTMEQTRTRLNLLEEQELMISGFVYYADIEEALTEFDECALYELEGTWHLDLVARGWSVGPHDACAGASLKEDGSLLLSFGAGDLRLARVQDFQYVEDAE